MSKHKKAKQLPNNKKKKQQQQKKNATQKVPSIDELIQAGDAASLAMEGDKAMAFYTSALTLMDDDKSSSKTDADATSPKLFVHVLEKLGELKASEGNSGAAKQDFERAIAIMTTNNTTDNPKEAAQYQETLAGLHLYIGQLSCEQEALQAYQKGLQCLETALQVRQQQDTTVSPAEEAEASMEVENEKEENGPQVALKEVRRKLASARATVAELYLTDLCYDDNAETECEKYVNLALEIKEDDDNDDKEPCMVDALQTAASLKLSQQQTQSALAFILRAFRKMQVGCEALSQLGGMDGKRAVELLEVDAAESLPSFDFRCQTAKLLLECATNSAGEEDATKCHTAAIQVLGSLLAENDEVPDIYYLLGCAYNGENNAELAQYYWKKAMEMLEAIQKEMEQQQAEDGDMQVEEDEDDNDEMEMQIQAISCQIEEIKSKLEDLESKEPSTNKASSKTTDEMEE
ncbi:TPR domain protein [Seminavis robusta]|uniref:TPR domain protein n=1 Tax=Seminavis robusta TaxID=568900 RepID=A0A9N8F3F2_9STRA|nr:TPR domain protein [Seminavis robusta]|eukprot:Sro2619_g332840.1 TPR domain protein (462) ;mRNA; f:4764-6316